MTKKLMALLLAVLMAVSLLPMPAMADGATPITSLSDITGAGSYVLNKDVKDVSLSGSFTVSADVTIELTGQTVTLQLPEGGNYADSSVFHVTENGSLTLKGSGTVKVPDKASGIIVDSKASLSILGEVSISGGSNGVKATSGESRVKISVNTLGTIESDVGINLSGASGEIKIASGTVKGSVCAIGLAEGRTLKLADILADGSNAYTGGAAVAKDTALTADVKELVFDNGQPPVQTISSAVRTSETEAAVTFTASKAGTYYYQLDGETAPTAEDLFKTGAKQLVRGENTIPLTLDEKEHTVYIAAKDAFGNATGILTTDGTAVPVIPAVLAAPANPVWSGKAAKWDAVTDATGYTVQLYKDGKPFNGEFSVSATQTDDLSKTMTADGSYTFKVRATADNTVGRWSDESKALPVDVSKPTLTEKSVTRETQESASITFSSTEGGTLYYLVGGDDTADVFAEANKKENTVTAGDKTLAITGLTSPDKVTVRIGVMDAANNPSDVLNVTVPLFVPAPGNARWDDQTAAWDAVAGATYTVKLFRDGTEVALANTTTADTKFTFSFETSGVYTFQVQAVKDGVTSQPAVSGELTVDKTAPEITNESASRTDASNGSVTFRSDEAGKVYYIVGGDTPTKEAVRASEKTQAIAAGDNSVDISGITDAKAVNVYLVAVDEKNNASDVVTVTVPVFLAKPTTLTWVNGTTTALWDAVDYATAYNIQLLKDGASFDNTIVVNGGSVTKTDLASYMTEDGVYTFKVQATAAGTQSEWSDVSATSYTRDILKPTVKAADPPRRIDAKTAEFSFIASEDGIYYYMVGLVNGGVPTAEQVADDKNPHAGCTNAKTTIKLTDIADTNARKVYVAVRDKAGNLSEKPFEITIPAYTVTPTPTPTTAPATPTPTAAPTTYTVTLQGGTGYTIAATGGSKSPVNAGGSFSFTVTPSSGYTRGNGFAVKANGTTLTSNNGVYTISNINANQTVSVSGIVKSQNGGGTLPAAPAITTTTLAAATMGKEYRQQITATGGTPITWSYSGTLPDGMTLAANTGILSGTPTQEGSFRFAVKATNSTGFSTRQMTLVVAGSEYSVTKGANSEWTQGGDKGIDFSGSGKGTFTVKVDGAAVAAGKYTASSDGSTVTLKPEYLDTLAAGSHTVTLVYTDGSAKAKFTIKAKDKTVAPTVSSQPTDADVAPDGSATFTVTASGTTPLLCQWQVDKNDGSGWTDISGAVNASYTVEKVTAEQNGWKYRCVIKNAAGSVESNAATLTIKEAIGDVKKNDDQKDSNSGGLGRILLITGIVVAVLALAAGLYFYFRRRNTTRYID